MNTNIKIFEDNNRLVIEIAKENVKELLTNNLVASTLSTLISLAGGDKVEIPNLEASTEQPISPLSENAKPVETSVTSDETPADSVETINYGDVIVNTIGTTKTNPVTVEELVTTNIKLARWIIDKMADNKNAEILKQRNAIVEYFKANGIS